MFSVAAKRWVLACFAMQHTVYSRMSNPHLDNRASYNYFQTLSRPTRTVPSAWVCADIKNVDAGEDVSEELKGQEKAQWQWRVGCMGRPLPGAALEDSADELKGIANYEGTQPQTCC